MHITKIELEDIKSHREAVFEFQRGTTAITGENGAGKTTIIEAVAWTLFDLLDYKKDDFVRRGAKKGVVNVTFESGLDEREYRVYRDTGTGYYVYDPQLKTRIAEKKDEVRRFLRQHLGVDPGTDLESLFRRAIGVPQGTFTAIFLETPAERKKAFDRLLKVEEYRESADKLRETANFIKTKQIEVGNKIAYAEGKLADFERIETEFENFSKQSKELTETLETTEREVAKKTETVRKFDETEKSINELKNVFEKLNAEKTRSEIILGQKELEKTNAENAALKIKSVEADNKIHMDALAKLKELERERGERDKLNTQITNVKSAIVKVEAEHKAEQINLENSQNGKKEIAELTPKIAEQNELEQRRDELINDKGKTESVEGEIKRLEKKMDDLREKLTENIKQIKFAEEKTVGANNLDELEKKDADLKNNLANLRAKLQNDLKFQSEIKNGLCPILSEKCLNLKPGQTLESFVSGQFEDVKIQITTIETEQRQIAATLSISREAGKYSAQLDTLRTRKEEISKEGIGYKNEKEELQKKLENLPKLKQDLTEIERKLEALGNPKNRIKHLEKEADREIVIREKLTEAESNLERLENDKNILLEQIESYKDLDENWTEFSVKRDATINAHRTFLANEDLAKSLPEKEKELKRATEEIEKLKTDLAKAESEFNAANEDYDREKHLSERANLLEAERRLVVTKTNLENAKNRAAELEKELENLKKIRKEMQTEFQEKERLEKIAVATDFIRDTLKKSAPLVAKNYVYHVSIEANQMFREISGNAERTLKWTEDYGIVLEEGGHERPFVNLSGGEQMAAALSVRLALLKQLSDVRLAFFDEPTTNMDITRRERLAEQISQITEKQTFDQLFVISHDDTFEGYVDNVISVGGNENE